MASVQVYDFGERNGVKTYRVNGDKKDLEKLLEECRKADARFDDTPILNHVRKGQWSVVLKLKLPVGVGERVD